MVRRLLVDVQLVGFEHLKYSDKEDISEYAKEAIGILFAKGIMIGNSEREFNPKGYATRAEVAKVLSVLYDILY